jgi:glycosyltransferase involved in cell wall biosynthesis
MADLVSTVRLCRILRDGSFDVVHAHCAGAGFVARLANVLSRRHLPVVYTPHFYSFDMPDFGRVTRAVCFLVEKALAATTDYTVCVSDVERLSAERLHARKMTVVKIPNGINVQPRARAERRASGVTRVHFIGRLSLEKAPDVLLEAWSEIEAMGLPATADIVGSGPLEPRLRERAQELQLKTLRFLGHVPDASRQLTSSDVVVIPSRHEALPYVLLEAMAAECAIVASRVGGIEEWITCGRSGLLIDPADRVGLVGALSLLIGDEELRKRLGREARATLSNRGSLEEMLSRHEDLYEALV